MYYHRDVGNGFECLNKKQGAPSIDIGDNSHMQKMVIKWQ